VFAHCSDEQGHRLMLEHLDARPLLQLDLRLGEGTGSALALPLLHAAVNFLAEMATFSSAQVSTSGQ
jgi:nicotinate-nucleotide--dimethylbenzimidazole phosphoribosyltransferase